MPRTSLFVCYFFYWVNFMIQQHVLAVLLWTPYKGAQPLTLNSLLCIHYISYTLLHTAYPLSLLLTSCPLLKRSIYILLNVMTQINSIKYSWCFFISTLIKNGKPFPCVALSLTFIFNFLCSLIRTVQWVECLLWTWLSILSSRNNKVDT